MTASFLDILSVHLLPFALAVPLALLVLLIVWRHGDHAGAPRIDLSASKKPAAKPHTVGSAPAIPMVPPAVLVVDDSAVARAKLRRLFESAQFVVQVANDGVHALEVLAQCRVNVVVTDLEMPRLDGFGLIAAITGAMETEDLPIIAITGHDDMQARVHAVEGLYGIYKKPWNDRELLKRVTTLAAMHPIASGSARSEASRRVPVTSS